MSASQYTRGKEKMADFYLVNDLIVNVSGTVDVTVWHWGSTDERKTISVAASQPPQSAGYAFTLSLASLLKEAKCVSGRECVAEFTFTCDQDPLLTSRNVLYLSSPKDSALSPPSLKIIGGSERKDRDPMNRRLIDVQYSFSAIAPYVWFESPFDGSFSDNGFLATPSLSLSVSPPFVANVTFVSGDNDWDVQEFLDSLQVWSLNDIYQ